MASRSVLFLYLVVHWSGLRLLLWLSMVDGRFRLVRMGMLGSLNKVSSFRVMCNLMMWLRGGMVRGTRMLSGMRLGGFMSLLVMRSFCLVLWCRSLVVGRLVMGDGVMYRGVMMHRCGGMMHRCGGMVHWSLVMDRGSMMSHGFVVDWSCLMNRSFVMDRRCVMAMGSDTMSMCFRKRAEMWGILVVLWSLVMDWGIMVGL